MKTRMASFGYLGVCLPGPYIQGRTMKSILETTTVAAATILTVDEGSELSDDTSFFVFLATDRSSASSTCPAAQHERDPLR
jgi:hypothetical protein